MRSLLAESASGVQVSNGAKGRGFERSCDAHHGVGQPWTSEFKKRRHYLTQRAIDDRFACMKSCSASSDERCECMEDLLRSSLYSDVIDKGTGGDACVWPLPASMYIVENLDLEALAEAAYRFAVVVPPLKVRGGCSGSALRALRWSRADGDGRSTATLPSIPTASAFLSRSPAPRSC